MPIGWGAAVAEALGIAKTFVNHKLKSASEKLEDDRYENLKGWQKWKRISNDEQEERKKRAKELRS